MHLAKSLGCHVLGVTLEESGVAAGYEAARRSGVDGLVTFRQGDLLSVDLDTGAIDVALMECVLSILPQKEAALSRLWEALRPGGRLAVTDVTVSGPVPPDLQGLLAVAGCVGDARSQEGYRVLLESQGFAVDETEDLRETVESLLKSIKGKMMMGENRHQARQAPRGDRALQSG